MDESPAPIPIACRFIPYDQWLVTHISPTSKVKDIKVNVLAKCITHPQHPAQNDASYRNQRKRAPSPITFAQDPKQRPMSPITFAKSVLAREQESHSSYSSEAETGQGYEEDNEGETDGDDAGSERGRSPSAARILPQTDPNAAIDSHALHMAAAAVTAHSKRSGGSGPYDVGKLTVIRYSTGQLLDDDMPFGGYAIQPYELLEIHRAGTFLRLPRHNISLYVQPYWEGSAKALRQVVSSSHRPKPRDGSKSLKKQGTRSSLQWRPRWVIIHGGVLTLRKEPDEPEASQSFPLSTLCDLRGQEYLTRVSQSKALSSQRVVCVKFREQEQVRPKAGATHAPSGSRSVSQPVGPRPQSTSAPRSQSILRDYSADDEQHDMIDDIFSVGSAVASSAPTTVSTGPTTSAPSSLKHNLKAKVKATPPLPSFGLKNGPSLEDSDEGRRQHKKGKLRSKRSKRASLSNIVSQQPDDAGELGEGQEAVNHSGNDEADDVSLPDVKEEPSKSLQTSSTRHSAVAHAKPHASRGQSPISGSDSFSSPRFAHSNLVESDVDSDDGDFYGSRPRLHNYYGYGYGSRGAPKSQKDGSKDDDESGKPSIDDSFVHVPEDVPEDASLKPPPRRKAHPRKSRGDNGEWVVLELEDDNAYTSILRTLHRHFSDPLSSSFVSVLPPFGPARSDTQAAFSGADPDTASLATQTDETLFAAPAADQVSVRTTSTQRNSVSQESDLQLNRMPTILSITPSVSATTETQSLRSNRSSQHDHTNFGAIPYPEWRTLISERAQRAGLGESTRAIEKVLLEPSAPYETRHHTSLFIVGRDNLGPKMGSRRTVTKRARPRLSARPSPLPSPMQESPFAHMPWHEQALPDAIGPTDGDSDSDSGNNSSEVEWLGWMGDLRRQTFVRKEKDQNPQQNECQESDVPLTPMDTSGAAMDFSMPKPDDHRLFASQRYALEPSATVATFPIIESSPESVPTSPLPFPTTESSSKSSPGHHTALSMSSPSAADQPSPVRARAVSFGPVPSEPVSLAASASKFHHEPRTEPLSGHTQISNASSWEDLVSRSHHAGGQGLANPAGVTANRPIKVSTSSSVVQEPSHLPPARSSAISAHLSPDYERSSLSPLDRAEGTSGRSAGVFGKAPSLLRKKSAEPSFGSYSKSTGKRAKSSKGKEKEISEPPPGDRSRRPRLSVSTGSHGNLRHQHSLSNVSYTGSDPRSPSPGTHRIMSADEATSPIPANETKRKRGIAGGMERIAQRFDAAMDFVDGR